MKAFGTHFSVRFFTAILICSGALLVMLAIYDYRAEEAIKNLKEHYDQIDHFRNDIIQFDEILTTSARMAAATGDLKWEKRFQEYEPKLTAAIRQATNVSPEIYREDRSHIRTIELLDMEHKAFDLIGHGQGRAAMDILFGKQYEIQKNAYTGAIERLNALLKHQMQAALEVEHSKEYLSRVSFITVLCLLLLSWLIILRIARKSQEDLLETNRKLSERTRQLDELNRTLELRVQERTESLMTVQTQLLQAEKFSAIGQLAAGIAHEINNPIGFINSNLQTLQQYVTHYTLLLGMLIKLEKALKGQDQKRAYEAASLCEKTIEKINFPFIDRDVGNLLKESREGIEKIGKIVADLRTFASPDRGMMDSVNIEALMESMLNIVYNEIKYKVKLKKDYGHVPTIVCNPQKIGQVFVNLLINAAQAIKDQGMITIKTYTKDEYVCMDLIDTGCGIALENMTKVFDPFFTTKAPGTGVGLGLSISYDIIRKHGGTMSFHSKEGQGTTFTVMLPKAANAVELGGAVPHGHQAGQVVGRPREGV
ncbi:MAG: hypothetical protein HQL14_04305 [Candidatus Omnitrophica bacterium]|nr:hypothetical protein [Candidatus Omnitrophota bacterium]